VENKTFEWFLINEDLDKRAIKAIKVSLKIIGSIIQ
jgi:hypothetical protein